MRANSEACLVDAQANCVDGSVSTEPTRIDVGASLRRAVEGSGRLHKTIAREIDYSPDHWNLILESKRGVVLERLGALPRDVQIAFLSAWAAQLGIRVERRADRGDRFAPDLAELIAQRRVRITLEPLEP